MVVYTGRRGLHIFDIDRERWVFNSNKKGYNYQDHYYLARKIESTAHEEGGLEDGEEESEEELTSGDDSFGSALDDILDLYDEEAKEEIEETNQSHQFFKDLFDEIMQTVKQKAK